MKSGSSEGKAIVPWKTTRAQESKIISMASCRSSSRSLGGEGMAAQRSNRSI